jgi:hypothetical protein
MFIPREGLGYDANFRILQCKTRRSEKSALAGNGKRTTSYCHPIPEFVEPLRFNGKFDTL